MTSSNKKNIITALIAWLFVVIAIRVFGFFQHVSFIYENMAVITAVILLYTPVLVSIRRKKPIEYWRLKKDSLLPDLKILLLVSVIIFPLSFVVNHFYQVLIQQAVYHPGHSKIWTMFIFTQLVLVAFPEEFFFRGFLQEVFVKAFPAKRKVFGVPMGMGIVFVSLVFAFSHSLIALQWWHGLIFFPALVFAWLKERTGTVWASVVFHAACNVFAYWVALHY